MKEITLYSNRYRPLAADAMNEISQPLGCFYDHPAFEHLVSYAMPTGKPLFELITDQILPMTLLLHLIKRSLFKFFLEYFYGVIVWLAIQFLLPINSTVWVVIKNLALPQDPGITLSLKFGP